MGKKIIVFMLATFFSGIANCAHGRLLVFGPEFFSSSLSDLKNRSENPAGRGQILTILQGNSCSIAQKSGEICTGQADLQPISFKSDRLLAKQVNPGG